MKSKTYRSLVALSFLFATCMLGGTRVSRADDSSAFDELNDTQKAAVMNGQQVYFDQKVPGSPWPKMFLYQKVDCTPEQAAAVTMDWTLRPSYTSGLKSAQVSKVVDANTDEVDYVLSVPFLGDEPFTLSNMISPESNGAGYRLDWHLVRAKRTKTSEGFTRFETLGNATLMAINSFVDPGVALAGLATNNAIQQFKDAANGFVNQVGKELQGDQSLIERQVQALHTALGR